MMPAYLPALSLSGEPGDEWDLPQTAGSTHPPTIVIGLGNPILGDDGVGWQAAAAVQNALASVETADWDFSDHAEIQPPLFPVEIDCLALGGLSLMERLVGYHQAIIIDAITTRQAPPGTIHIFPLEDLPLQAAAHLTAAHDTSLQNAIALGRAMGACLPQEILIVAIEAEICYDFSEQLSPAVADAVPRAAQATLDLLIAWAATHTRIPIIRLWTEPAQETAP